MFVESGMFAFVIIALAIAAGFLLGYRQGKKTRRLKLPSHLSADGSAALDQLAEAQSDEAIDQFIADLAVNNETLDTHFALGKLLRKRGETEKAVKIHQNLLSRPNLDQEQQHLVQLELAYDYQKSGLLDRAETLLLELTNSRSADVKRRALEHLVDVYQGEKEWERGIEIASKLTDRKVSRRKEHWSMVQCHFCCELTQQMLEKSNLKEANKWLEKAEKFDPQNIRVALSKTQLALLNGEDMPSLKKALEPLKQIKVSHPLYFTHVIPLLAHDESDFPSHSLQMECERLQQQAPSEWQQLILASAVFRSRGSGAAFEYLRDAQADAPTIDVVIETLSLLKEDAIETLSFAELIAFLKARVEEATRFQCVSCGFESLTHFWACPTCKKWETLEPK